MRYGLSGEAGLNDGLAFPFVVLALLWLERDGPGSWLGGWAAHRLLWAVPVGLFVGYVLGRLLGHLAVYIRSRERDTAAPSDFLALALIALAYVSAEAVSAWGFLSVFAAGMGLRRAERKIVQESPHTATPTEHGAAMKADESDPAHAAVESHPPAENLIPKASSGALEQPAVAAGTLLSEVLSFGDTTERLLEVALVLIVGISLAQHWDPRAFALAFVLMVVIRPIGAHFVLLGTPTTSAQRWLIGWFGIRGIGSLYYLAYALREGLPAHLGKQLSALTLSVVAISVIAHGITSQPMLARYERTLAR